MISVVVLTRNAPRLAGQCLQSLLECAPVLASAGRAEYLLFDDCSDAGRETLPLLKSFRTSLSSAAPTTIVRFRRQVHYSTGLAHALSLARGDAVLFVSQDMLLAPACVEELLAVAAQDSAMGVIRPTSQHMDWAGRLVHAPPVHPRSLDDVAAFAATVRRERANDVLDWPMLIGDAMLVTRRAMERIGTFDPQFYGFMGDVDYGVRLWRAGFRHVIARGAWLHHEGNGTAKETASSGGPAIDQQGRRMLELVDAAYARFRRKWGESFFPPHFRELKRSHFEQLHAHPGALPGDAYQPPLVLSDEIAEVL